MADQNSVDELRGIVANCISTPIDELVSRPEWGTINFDGLYPKVGDVMR